VVVLSYPIKFINIDLDGKWRPFTSFLTIFLKQLIQFSTTSLTPKDPEVIVFVIINSIDQTLKRLIQMGPNFIQPESAKDTACVGQQE